MEGFFRVDGFVAIWGATIGSSIWVGQSFGVFAGIVFFLFFAGIVGFAGMLIVAAIAKIFGVNL